MVEFKLKLDKDKLDIKKTPVQIAVLLGTLALALVSNVLFGDPKSSLSFLPILFGILVVIEIAYFVGSEVKDGAQRYGWKHEIVDTIIALLVAVGIWFGASIILNTSSPISAVVSCSMLPNLQRGDFVIVQGAPVSAYEIDMTEGELASLTTADALITYGNGNASTTIRGSIYPYCVNYRQTEVCRTFISAPESVIEKKGAFTYRYERCRITLTNGSTALTPCLKSVTFRDTEYLTNFSHDISVYQPSSQDIYSRIGDIVHRVMFKINVDGNSYYLTRGDNNPLLDIQVYDYQTGLTNHPFAQSQLKGRVLGRIPFLGYFKLFISGYFKEDSQCRTQLEFSHV